MTIALYEDNLDMNQPSILLAMPELQTSCFHRSVILLVDHAPSGSFGFILNRPGTVKLSELLEGDYDVPPHLHAWYGGPVDPASGIILSATQEEASIAKGVSISTSPEILRDLLQSPPPALGANTRQTKVLYPYRFLVGYAGWGEGQLDAEIRAGLWIQAPLNNELIFNVHWDNMWDYALQGLGIRSATLAPSFQNYLN
jgi:putative transcriptional regulator